MLRRFSDIGVLVDGNILFSLSIYSFSLLYDMEEVDPLDNKKDLGLRNDSFTNSKQKHKTNHHSITTASNNLDINKLSRDGYKFIHHGTVTFQPHPSLKIKKKAVPDQTRTALILNLFIY